MSECGACRYKGVKGLVTDQEFDKEILELFCSSQLFAEVVRYHERDFSGYQSAILYGGPGELLSYSRIIDLSDADKSYSPFEKPENRIISGFSFCHGEIDSSLDKIDDPIMQTMVAMGKLIDIARENGNQNSKIVMLTYEGYQGCCPFGEGMLKFELADTLEYVMKK